MLQLPVSVDCHFSPAAGERVYRMATLIDPRRADVIAADPCQALAQLSIELTTAILAKLLPALLSQYVAASHAQLRQDMDTRIQAATATLDESNASLRAELDGMIQAHVAAAVQQTGEILLVVIEQLPSRTKKVFYKYNEDGMVKSAEIADVTQE